MLQCSRSCGRSSISLPSPKIDTLISTSQLHRENATSLINKLSYVWTNRTFCNEPNSEPPNTSGCQSISPSLSHSRLIASLKLIKFGVGVRYTLSPGELWSKYSRGQPKLPLSGHPGRREVTYQYTSSTRPQAKGTSRHQCHRQWHSISKVSFLLLRYCESIGDFLRTSLKEISASTSCDNWVCLQNS